MLNRIADSLNLLGAFCGMRDLPTLTQESLLEKYNIRQADAMVLFGGSIIAGGDMLARAMKENVAKNYIIVGGEGHTTFTIAGPTGEGLTSARSFTRQRRCVMADSFHII